MNTFSYLKIDVEIENKEYMPPFFIGSMIRGVIGTALKSVSCVNPSYKCEGCLYANSCTYHHFFEETNRFHPYRLGIELQQKDLDFSIYLYGHAVKELGHLLSAIKMGFEELGIGREQKKMKVRDIKVFGRSIFDGGEVLSLDDHIPKTFEIERFYQDVALEFTMPLRIKVDNRLAKKEITLHGLVNNIHNRLLQIRDEPLKKLDYKVRGEIVSSSLRFVETERFSNRQKQKMNMGGLKGSIKIEGLDKQSALYLQMGEILGAGKQTVFGLGSYKLKELCR